MSNFLKNICLTFLLVWSATANADFKNINNQQLASMLEGDVLLVDIRREDEWLDTGVIEDSLRLTFFDKKGAYDARAWLTEIEKVKKPDQKIVLICYSGVRTRVVSHWLSNQLGWDDVYNVKGGIVDWIKDDRDVIKLPEAQ